MARGQHDQPNPNLIIEGSQKSNPSKRVQGQDYPTTAIEELDQRNKSQSSGVYATMEFISIFLYRCSYFNEPKSEWNCVRVLFEDRRCQWYLLQGYV